MYREIGIALTNWAMVEKGLAEVVEACQRNALDGLLEGYALLSIQGFREKLQFVDARVKGCFRDYPDKLVAWKKFFKEADALSQERNKIAHWEAHCSWPGGGLLMAPFLRKDGLPGPPEKILTLSDINLLGRQFYALHCKLANFGCMVLRERQGPRYAVEWESAGPRFSEEELLTSFLGLLERDRVSTAAPGREPNAE